MHQHFSDTINAKSDPADARPPVTPTRRAFLRGVGGVLAVATVGPAVASEASPASLPIALTDRGMGMGQTLGSFAVARDAGATGVEVDFGRLATRPDRRSRLITPAGRRQFIDAASSAGMRISSLAFTTWTEQSLVGDGVADAYAEAFVDAAARMAVPVAVLPIDGRDEWLDPRRRQRSVDQLKRIATAAERAGVVLALDADVPVIEVKRLLDDVGSTAVGACVLAASAAAFQSAFALLGADRIAQLRFRYDQAASQAATIAAVKDACTAAAWGGWIVIDRPAASTGHALGDARLAVRRLARGFEPRFA